MGELITTFEDRRKAQIQKERGIRTTSEITRDLRALGYPPDFWPFEPEPEERYDG